MATVGTDRRAVRICIHLVGAPGGRALPKNAISFERCSEPRNKCIDQLDVVVRAGQPAREL
jgi:hypothetical protein